MREEMAPIEGDEVEAEIEIGDKGEQDDGGTLGEDGGILGEVGHGGIREGMLIIALIVGN